MQKELWVEVNRLAKQALDLPANGRDAFLFEACEGEPFLLQEIRDMLCSIEEVDDFMETPVLSKLDLVLDQEKTAMPRCIGNWRIVSQLGEGGMGVVYLAKQLQPIKRQVALKVIKAGYDSKEVLARFSSEHQALAYMDHPYIARIYESGITITNAPYFTMEYLPGEPLTDYCRTHELPLSERLKLFCRVCEGVQHAHQKGVIHCDLKPSNIIVVDQDGVPHPKLIDFGIARAIGGRSLTDRTLFTRQMGGLGTPAYMSPEQANCNGVDIDTRTDVYALGAILYELLCGVPPCDIGRLRDASLTAKLRMICDEEIIPPSIRKTKEGRPYVSNRHNQAHRALVGDLDWIAMKALEKNRSRRYDSAAELARDIKRHLRNEPVTASPPSQVYKLKKFMLRNRTWVASLLVALTAVTLGLGLLFWGLVEAGTARLVATKAEALAEVYRRELEDTDDFLVRAFSGPFPETEGPFTEVASILDSASPVAQDNLSSSQAAVVHREIKLLTVLDQAVELMAVEFKELPRRRANISLALGRTFLGLGFLAKADGLLTSAFFLYKDEFGPNHAKTLEAKFRLAKLRYHQGEYEIAERLSSELVSTQRVLHGGADPRTLRSRLLLANIYKEQDRLDIAINHYQDVLAKQIEIYGERHLETADTLVFLGNAIYFKGDFVKSEGLYNQAIAIQGRLLGQDHRRLLETKFNLSNIMDIQGRFSEAEPILEEILASRLKHEGEHHPETLKARQSLARLKYRQRKLPEAELIAAEALEASRQHLGIDQELTQTLNEQYGLILGALGCYHQAEEILDQVVRFQSGHVGRAHDKTLRTATNQAHYLKLLGRYQEAEALLVTNLEMMEASGAVSNRILHVKCTLAELYLARNELDSAEILLAELVALVQRDSQPNEFYRVYVENVYGRWLTYWERFAEAETILQACSKAWNAPDSDLGAKIQGNLDELYTRWGIRPVAKQNLD